MRTALKKVVYAGLYGCYRAVRPFVRGPEVSVLCYHSISSHSHWTAVDEHAFERHIRLLRERGYLFVSLGDVLSWMDGAKTLPQRIVALTFDDGYADFETAVLPLLQKYNAPAALFVVEGNVDKDRYLTREALARVQTSPLVTVGFHSHTHPNLSTLSRVEIDAEVQSPFTAEYFAYPGGNYSSDAIAALKAFGYRAAFSIKPTLTHKTSDRYLMPRNVITGAMRDWEVLMRTSTAIDWYRVLKNIV